METPRRRERSCWRLSIPSALYVPATRVYYASLTCRSVSVVIAERSLSTRVVVNDGFERVVEPTYGGVRVVETSEV
jgi:hypothetical protein